jgi:CzcA family heavy metal efflux pump
VINWASGSLCSRSAAPIWRITSPRCGGGRRRQESNAATADAIGAIVVAEKDGVPIRVRQVADISASEEEKTTVVSANGSESVLLNVIRQPSANSVAMVAAVEDEIQAIRAHLPADVQIGTFYDQSVLIKEAVNSVRDAVIIGAILSIVVLQLFLRDIRATIVTGAIIPVTLLITFLLMRLAGLTLNLMTLGALAVGIGLVIDDAIVVVECVFRNLEPGMSIAEAVRRASAQIAAPMVSSTLTTVVVFLPLAFLAGVAGAFFSALALTLTMALMVSLTLALCVSPSLCAAFLRNRANLHDEGRAFGAITRGYKRLLGTLLDRRWVVIPIIGLTLIGTGFFAGKLDTGFMPTMDEGAFVLDYWTPAGTSLAESDRLLQKVDKILKSTPEVTVFSRRTGTELGFAITESNRGDYAVMLKTGARRNIEEVMAGIRDRIQSEIPGLDVEFIQVLQDLIGDLAGNPNPIEVKLFGENKAEIEQLAEDLAGRLEKCKGLVDVNSGILADGPEVSFDLDPALVGRRGMTTQAVADQANAALIGTVATEVLQGDRQIPVRVRLPESSRSTVDEVSRIGIQTPFGRVLLKDLGSVQLVPGTTQSAREDQRRFIAVTASLEGVDLGTAISEVRATLATTKLPPGVDAVLAGQYQSQQESFRNLTFVLGAAVLLVFTVMLFQFRAFAPPLVILILMPLSLFGAVLALWITHTALNVSSFMGVIMLAGIVVKNGILLLDRAQHFVEGGVPMRDAVLRAGEQRLRPILMTTLTAILGLLPLALGLGAGAEMQKPLAVAVVGGLAFSTVLTLLVGPVVFASLSRQKT